MAVEIWITNSLNSGNATISKAEYVLSKKLPRLLPKKFKPICTFTVILTSFSHRFFKILTFRWYINPKCLS